MKVAVLGLAMVLAPGLFAQTDAGTPAEPPDNPDILYDMTLVVYTWPVTGILHSSADLRGLPELYLAAPTGARRVSLQRGGFSPPIRYQSATSPVLVRAEERTREDGTRERLPIPVVRPDIDPAWESATIIVYPERRLQDGTWAHVVLPTSRLEMPDGSSRFMNMTPQPIVIEMAGETHAIRPGGLLDLPAPGEDAPDRFRLNIHARDPRRGEVRLLHTTALWRENANGNLYLIHNRKNRPRVLHLSPPRPEPVTETASATEK